MKKKVSALSELDFIDAISWAASLERAAARPTEDPGLAKDYARYAQILRRLIDAAHRPTTVNESVKESGKFGEDSPSSDTEQEARNRE